MIYNITISKARDGKHDYMQIMSEDMVSVNIVLVADKIIVDDKRVEKQ